MGGLEFSAVRFQLDFESIEIDPDDTNISNIVRDKTTSSLFILSLPVLAEIELPLGFYGQLGPRVDFEIASNNGTADNFIIKIEDKLSDFSEFLTFGWSAGVGNKIGIAGLELDIGFRFNTDITDFIRDDGFTDMKKQRVDFWIKLPLPF